MVENKTLDCRGLACPAPVLQTKQAIEKDGAERISVFVDNEAAKQNVSRFLETRNYRVSTEQEEGGFQVKGEMIKGKPSCEVLSVESAAQKRKIMVMAAADRMGRGDDELGGKLMINFLKTLKEMGDDLWRLVFLNDGVKLTVEGSGALRDLKELENAGTTILVCGTCLNHFHLLEKKQVGETTNMLDIVTAMQLADSVVNI